MPPWIKVVELRPPIGRSVVPLYDHLVHAKRTALDKAVRSAIAREGPTRATRVFWRSIGRSGSSQRGSSAVLSPGNAGRRTDDPRELRTRRGSGRYWPTPAIRSLNSGPR